VILLIGHNNTRKIYEVEDRSSLVKLITNETWGFCTKEAAVFCAAHAAHLNAWGEIIAYFDDTAHIIRRERAGEAWERYTQAQDAKRRELRAERYKKQRWQP